MKKLSLMFLASFFLSLFSNNSSAIVGGALLHLDASDNPGHNKSWKNLGEAGGELLVADESPVLEEGKIEIPKLGISKKSVKYYTTKKSLQTFGVEGKNPELAVEDWTLEFLCRRNGGLFKEEHHFAGFQNIPREGKQGIRLWMEGEEKLGISIHAEGGKKGVQPLNIKLSEGVWTWLAIVGTNKKSIIAYQDGEQVSKQPGFEFQKKWVLNEISIGANSHSERRRTFNGSFAIVRVYDKALTEAQINENIESAFDVEPVGKLSTTWSSIKEQY
ncbi:MAG: hypothetical protein CML13_01290 [Puniceicoccaceae bacterium]|nr:hypothetical protein [Puniceicoccaceae bacterium]